MTASLKTSAQVRAPHGADAAKEIPGYTPKQSISDSGYTPALVTYRDALDCIVNRLATQGYLLRAEQDGDFCGFNVYHREAPSALPGLKPDRQFQQYRRVLLSDQRKRDAFYFELDSVVVALLDECDEKSKMSRFLMEAISDFKDKPRNNKSGVGQASASFGASAGQQVTITGRSGLCKVVPPRAWFSDSIQAVDARELLTLWPDAEAAMLMLMLGRIMIGPKNEPTAEGPIVHTMRSYGINVGHEPGLGKSTFLGWLIEALDHLGYSTEPINLRLGVFGWGSVAQADLAYVDDLSDEGQRSLMQLGLIKSIVSGHTIKAEEKGVPAEKVESRCVILGCSNGSDPSNFINMDAGAINRCNQLYTRTSLELTEAYGPGDHRLKQRWEAIAEEANTSPVVLMAWLLRSSVDYFLEISGHSLTERGTLAYDRASDQLEDTVRNLRDKFIIRVNLDHAESLMDAVLHGCALYRAGLTGEAATNFDRAWVDTDFSPSLVMACLEHQETRGALDAFPELKVSGLSRACFEYLTPKLPGFRTKAATMSLAELTKAVMGELVSIHGFRYPSVLTYYSPKWSARKRDFAATVAKYKNRATIELPSAVSNLIKDLGDTVT